MNLPKKVAVIGAGPAGITAAHELVKKGAQVDVYEASDSVGGMAKSINLWGYTVDIGPHRFFSSDTRVNKAWLEVVGTDYDMVDRLTRIYYKKKFFYYPLKALNALGNLGPYEAALCFISYLKEKINPTPDDGTFESWVTRRFGRRLFNIFFKTYTEKLWGISCKDLDADFAAQRIKKFSLGEAIKNALFGNSGKHKTLVDQFAYPYGGTGMVYERMAANIQMAGSNIFFKTPVQRVLTKDNSAYAIELVNGEIKTYDHIVSSMPLTLLVQRLPDVPQDILEKSKRLKYRNTIIVYLLVENSSLFPDNWLYIHSPDLQMGRLTNFRNWVPHLYGDKTGSVLALEYWCYDEDEFWKWDDERLINLAKKELRQTGLIGDSIISNGQVYRIPRCYPVYGRGYKDLLTPIENYLKTIQNLSLIGRYGAFKYNNQDHSILMGILAAENIMENAGHDLWEINTDYENYQEMSTITKSGLEKK
ncbi:MAG: FAD-dependent oxidoreductase [Chitinophagales bacterium]|nr:FAD-dependent oxidoreductase [Chitinophagales bacterium]